MYLQSNHVLESLIKNVEEDHYIRETKYNILMETLDNKIAGQQKKEETIQKQNRVAEKAAYELKYSNEKKWRNLLLASKFLQLFLKMKMDKTMGYYQQCELGYQKIKSQTGIENIQEVIVKFRSREQDYQNLVQQINSFESLSAQKKQEIQELRQQLEELQAQCSAENNNNNDDIDDGNIDGDNQGHQEQENGNVHDLLEEHNRIIKELAHIYQKEKVVEIFLQKMSEFMKRTNHRIGKIEGDNEQFDIKSGFMEQFMGLSGVIFKQIQSFNKLKSQKSEKEQHNIQDWSPSMMKGENKLESYTKRNVRVNVFEGTANVGNQNQIKRSNVNFSTNDGPNNNADKDYSIQQIDNSFGSDEYLVDVQEKQFLNQLRKEKKKQFEHQNKKGKKNKQ